VAVFLFSLNTRKHE